MRKLFYVLFIVFLIFCAYVIITKLPVFLADDGSGCPQYFNPNGGLFVDTMPSITSDCYAPQFYQQQKIIQLEEQNARIGALSVCISAGGFGQGGTPFSGLYQGGVFGNPNDLYPYKTCMQKVLNDTK